MSLPYQLIVFDWDGTLMDSEAKILTCMHAAIADLQLEPRSDDQLRNIIGLGLSEALLTLFPDITQTDMQRMTEQYRQHFIYKDDTPSNMFDGAEALLAELKMRQHYLAVATSKGRAGLNKVLDHCGLEHYFAITRCADETRSKPHPHMLEEIMRELNIDAASTLMIGDTEYDIKMAQNAGVDALAVSYGVHTRQRLLDCEPLACFDSLSELSNWLLNWHHPHYNTQ